MGTAQSIMSEFCDEPEMHSSPGNKIEHFVINFIEAKDIPPVDSHDPDPFLRAFVAKVQQISIEVNCIILHYLSTIYPGYITCRLICKKISKNKYFSNNSL